MVAALAATALLVAGGAFAGKGDACRRNLATAEKSAVVTNGVKWIDGRYLPVEGRAFDDVDAWYDRLPAGVTTNVNRGVRALKHHTAGMQFRFRTDSKMLSFRWVPYGGRLARQGYVVRVYDDMLTIERREFGEGGRLGTDWIMPLGQFNPHPFSKGELKKVIGEPQFRKGAKLEVSLDSNCNKIEKTADNNPVNPVNPVQDDSASSRLCVRIPLADGNPDSRVYAYEVEVTGDEGTPKLCKAIYAAGCNMGIGHEPNGGMTTLDIPKSELPPGKTLTFAVRPLTSLGTSGKAIATTFKT